MDLWGGRAEACVLCPQQATLRAERHHRELHVKLAQKLFRALLRGTSPEKRNLVVADFDYVRLLKAPEHLLSCFLLGAPERHAQIGVAGDELTGFLCIGDGLLRCRAGGLVCEAEGSEVEHARLVNEALIDLLPAELRVRAGLSREGKRAIASVVKRYKRERRKIIRVGEHTPCVNSGSLQRPKKQLSKRIVSDLSEKSGLLAVDIQRREKITGCAAGVGRHGGVAVGVLGFCGEIDEQLAERDNIKHSFSVPFRYFAAGYSLHKSRYGGSSSSISGKRPMGGLKRLSVLSSLHWLTSPSSTSPVPGSTVKS